jgi:hypothetical protein
LKEELVQKVTNLHEALTELNKVWNELNWALVPETVNEHYPFFQDLKEMEKGTQQWLEVIKKS